jgi:hypothetical protein
MKKLIIMLLALIPMLANAESLIPITIGSVVWQATTTTPSNGGKYVTVTFSLTTEAAPTDGSSAGIRLDGIGALSLQAESATNMTAGGVFLAYVQNPITLKWMRVSDGSLDLTTAATTKQAWAGLKVEGSVGRITWVPSGVGVATTLYIIGTVNK